MGVDEGANEAAKVGVGGDCLVGCGGGQKVCECGVDGFVGLPANRGHVVGLPSA